MKKAIFLLMLSASTIAVKSQTGITKVGGHGAGIAEITWVNGKPALNLGAYGGVLLNHKLLIGGAGNNIFFRQTVNGKKENFQFNYYGLYAEYRLLPEQPVNVSLGLTGALGWQENDITGAEKQRKKDGSHTYVLQPKIALNVKVTKFMQLQAYGSYRFTGNTNSIHYTNKNYNGVSAGAGLVFGSF